MTTERVSAEEELCAVCVDMGTTNTRVWLVEGSTVVAQARRAVGVRDTAREGSSARVRHELRDLIREVRAIGEKIGARAPSCVVAAGMITSPLGLAEVAHVPAPAGTHELARRLSRRDFPEITELPIFLVPGVRSVNTSADQETACDTDVMRGEETLCCGLVTLGLLDAGGTLLNLGSHWKVITLDAGQRIVSSVTSMSGELIHAAQTQTILASAVPPERPRALDEKWSQAGMREARRSGLGRALFCVRLLEQEGATTPDERLAFLVGAFIASDMDRLVARGRLKCDSRVVITGGGAALAERWQAALAAVAINSVIVVNDDVERALLRELREIVAASGALSR